MEDSDDCTASHCRVYNAYQFVLAELARFVLQLLHRCKAVFTDGAVSEDVIQSAFPSASAFLCCWHIFALGVRKHCSAMPEREEIQDFVTRNLRDADTETEFLTSWEIFQGRYPRAANYMQRWVDMRHRWAAPWRKQVFTAGKSGTSAAEASNAAVKTWVSHNGSLEDLLQATMRREQQSEKEEEDIAAHSAVNVHVLWQRPVDKLSVMEQCARHFTAYATKAFQEHFQDSVQYKAEINEESISVHRLSRKVPPRVITETNGKGGVSLLRCSCLDSMSMGIPCRHEICAARFLGRAEFCEEAFDQRWRIQQYDSGTGQHTEDEVISNISAIDDIPLQDVADVQQRKSPKKTSVRNR